MNTEWSVLVLGALGFIGWMVREVLTHTRLQAKREDDKQEKTLTAFRETVTEFAEMSKSQHKVIEHMTVGYPPSGATKKQIGGESDFPYGDTMEGKPTEATLEREKFEKANLEDLRRRMEQDAALSEAD